MCSNIGQSLSSKVSSLGHVVFGNGLGKEIELCKKSRLILQMTFVLICLLRIQWFGLLLHVKSPVVPKTYAIRNLTYKQHLYNTY